MDRKMLVQILGNDVILSLVLAAILFLILIGGVFFWIQRIRNRRIRKLEQLLTTNMTLSVSELTSRLDRKDISILSVIYTARHAENAILSFSKSSVVSSTLLIRRLHNLLVDNHVIHVAKESAMWDISEVIIENLVAVITNREGLDVVQTEDGDYILVPEFKERMREVIGLQGRINVTSEAQRLHVKRFDLVRLVERWGWNLIEMGNGFLVSTDWLRSTLERSMEKSGFIEPSMEAMRLAVTERDIIEAMRRFGWSVIQTTDHRLLPVHIVANRLECLLESEGYLNPVTEAKQLCIDQDALMKIVRRTGKKFFVDDDGIIVTYDYLKERVLDNLTLTGRIEVHQEADNLGIDARIVETILRNNENARTIGRGKYISTAVFRRWLLDEISEDGIISIDSVEDEWGITNPTLNILLKEFGMRTVSNKSGDHLSISWARTKITCSLDSGESVDPTTLVEKYNITVGIAQALLAQIDSDAVMNSNGGLVPVSKLKRELKQIFTAKGVLDPGKEARERMLDPSDVRQIISSLSLDALVSTTGTLISIDTIFSLMRWALDTKGSYDLMITSRRLRVDYSDLSSRIRTRLDDEDVFVAKAGVIVTRDWILKLHEMTEESGAIPVTTFAKEQGIRRGAMIELLRRFLKGAFVPRSDVFMVSRKR